MIRGLATFVTKIIDYFYKPFRNYLNIQTFRYIVCGGGNTLLDIVAFFLSYNFILNKQMAYIGPLAVRPHIMAFIIAFLISFPTGFFSINMSFLPDRHCKAGFSCSGIFYWYLCVFCSIIFFSISSWSSFTFIRR